MPNELAAIPVCQEQVREFFTGKEVSPRSLYHVELVLEEILTNIIRYGHDEGETCFIDVTISLRDGDVAVIIEDDGVPFDPTAVPVPASPTSLEEAPVGGQGIAMVRKIGAMDYQHHDGRNRLSVVLGRSGY